jgi:hypothetical protein
MSVIIAEQKAAAAQSVASFLAQFSDIAGQQKVANDALVEASNATNSKREALLRGAAQIAFASNWVDDACDGAVDVALAARNDQKSATLKTFASQLRLAMHSQVRQVLPSIFDLGTAAWDKEREAVAANDEAPQPLAKAFRRRTHMLVTLLRQVREHGASFPDQESIVRFGMASDPTKDDAKIAAKLKAMRKVFSAFHAEFPVEAFKSIDAFLGKIDAKTLREARDAANKKPEPAPSNLRKPEPAPAPEPANDAASDVLTDAIAEFNAA